eukprot:11524134-Alexandrium_andersonii.AAC.1
MGGRASTGNDGALRRRNAGMVRHWNAGGHRPLPNVHRQACHSAAHRSDCSPEGRCVFPGWS